MDRCAIGSAGAPIPMKPTDVQWLRETGGWTVSKFAEWMGVTRQTIANWESGRSFPTGPALRLLRMLEEEYGLHGIFLDGER